MNKLAILACIACACGGSKQSSTLKTESAKAEKSNAKSAKAEEDRGERNDRAGRNDSNDRGKRGKADGPLYERLGGRPAIAAVVDEFIARVASDPRIKHRFFNTDIPKLKTLLVEFVCVATGGPCKYTGRTMKEAHERLNITDGQWSAMVADFRRTLNRFNVPMKEQDELVAIVATTKKDIVK